MKDQDTVDEITIVNLIPEILEEVQDCSSYMDLLKTANEIYGLARKDLREKETDMADYGSLDAAADRNEN